MHIIGKILLWFYCLDISTAILILLAAGTAFLWLHMRFQDKLWWRWLLGLMLLCWAILVVYTTLINRESTEWLGCNMIPFHSYREALAGRTENLRSNFMNVALFYPAGLVAGMLLPRKWPLWVRLSLVTVLLGAVSIGIEWAQYRFALGHCEIDDVMHNAAGALLGSLLSRLPARRPEQ